MIIYGLIFLFFLYRNTFFIQKKVGWHIWVCVWCLAASIFFQFFINKWMRTLLLSVVHINKIPQTFEIIIHQCCVCSLLCFPQVKKKESINARIINVMWAASIITLTQCKISGHWSPKSSYRINFFWGGSWCTVYDKTDQQIEEGEIKNVYLKHSIGVLYCSTLTNFGGWS